MKTTAEFLDALRAHFGVNSDNKLAQAMGWKRQQLGRYRGKHETFSHETAVRIAAILAVDPAYLMACMEAQRAKSQAVRDAWTQAAARLAFVIVAAGIALAPGLGQFDISTITATPYYTLCVLSAGLGLALIVALARPLWILPGRAALGPLS